MNPAGRGSVRGRFLPCLAALAWFSTASAAEEDPVERGRALFEGAESAPLSIRMGENILPARGISCAGCHGGDAGGGEEAQSGPPIDWATLSQPSPSRPGYTLASFAAALTEGHRPGGGELGSAMPRFAFERPEDAAALAAYLRVVAARQRTGFTADGIVFRSTTDPVAKPFLRAFEARVTELAPNGVYGRRIRLSPEDAAFASIGAREIGSGEEMPDLFPLAPIVGDENPLDTRGAFASVADQVAALAEGSGEMVILATPAMRARLREALPRSATLHWRKGQAEGEIPILGIGAAHLARALEGTGEAPVYAMADDLAGVAIGSGRCLVVSDPRPVAGMPTEAPATRYGRTAATVLVEALRICGPDCTRSRLMRAFDGVRASPPDWPDLDYAEHPLTGSDEIALWSACMD